MPGPKAALIVISILAICVRAADDVPPAPRVSNKPFMLFVPPLLPPEGADRAGAFSNAIFNELRDFFDTTSFQAILVQDLSMVESMSNQKKDIVLRTDTTDCYLTGQIFDTLVVWLRYRVGLNLCRVDIPYPKGRQAGLPPLVATKVYTAIRNEFTGIVDLTGGPPGMTVTLVPGATVAPPRTMLLPPGEYFITSQYPGFQTRRDTLTVFQGRTTKKRILMLPD
ncbi:MAG: PEGA domain-containing protein [Chitinivibrionales bacterium]|nr:PEGA domain-containing protein [Chitinivibrionales bacterium]MBD3394647.1 PEGA domain-containing protein [Chitinivibrionales bacterium]